EFSERLAAAFIKEACSVPDSPGAELIEKAARLALTAHVVPSIESEVHRTLKTIADEVAIAVFADNVRQLLLASPFGSKAVLGVDPGVRTGCKLALISETGQFLDSATIHLRNDDEKEKAKPALSALLDKTPVLAIAVGNGTAGRETADFLRAAVKEQGRATPVVMVSEAGASVYSASAVAREEFPALDVSLRGAISIARRLQDPLAELVKIDPKSIGVGQYQHDVSPSGLKSSIERVVDSCVNQVGVNLNTASHHLLAHISGLGPALARAVVDHRVTHGLFRSRRQLLDVPRFSQKTFEQAAGFLRIPDGDVPFDNTGVHPERYPLLNGLAASLNIQPADLLGAGVERVRAAAQLREEIGAFTFDDIVKELEKPGRDPRQEFVAFEFRDDIHAISDLKKGMVCPGIVTNVTNFGAFVDIGVHHDGLVHISRLAERFVKDPREVVKPGDRVEVRVVEVDLEKIQISLSMKPEPKPVAAKKTARPRRPARREASAEAGVPAATSAKPSRPRPAPRPKREQPARADAQPQKGALPAAPPAPAAGPAGPARPRFDKKPQPQAAPSRDNRRPQRTREVFNNPFAALAGMKFDTKKK
ncbi:MAG: helix-hairpin-helix domain-containing protein, partial [Vicinamibacteria bacterium]|nr:helix-hairpin-helix domain-containing protein [Vicinamibacteria bacterium]